MLRHRWVNIAGVRHNPQSHGKKFVMQASFAQIVHKLVFSETLPDFSNYSEDCLFLNVWTPAAATKQSKLPVMVWIHGGGFTGGSGSGPGSAGDAFAKQGVILTTINYSLGRLGHFAFPALSKEHPEEFKGSYAYMDQIAALKWIKENIAAFGGDPNNVTIFGFSAGGVSVHSLLTIPAAKGLFIRLSVNRVVDVMVFSPADRYVKKMLILYTLFQRKQLG